MKPIKLFFLFLLALQLTACSAEKSKVPQDKTVLEVGNGQFTVHGQSSRVFRTLPKLEYIALLKQSEIREELLELETIYEEAPKRSFTAADLKPYLLDLRGNGEKRFLIVAAHGGGNACAGTDYFFDVRDNMTYYGKLAAEGENRLCSSDKNLNFGASVQTSYWGMFGDTSVYLPLRLAPGGEVLRPLSKFDIASYRKQVIPELLKRSKDSYFQGKDKQSYLLMNILSDTFFYSDGEACASRLMAELYLTDYSLYRECLKQVLDSLKRSPHCEAIKEAKPNYRWQ